MSVLWQVFTQYPHGFFFTCASTLSKCRKPQFHPKILSGKITLEGAGPAAGLVVYHGRLYAMGRETGVTGQGGITQARMFGRWTPPPMAGRAMRPCRPRDAVGATALAIRFMSP